MRSRSDARMVGASVNPQARSAHLEVHTKYGTDVLGLRPAQWEGSIYVHGPKLYGPASHLCLDNHITSRHINPADFRHLAGPTHQHSKQKDATFTRGDATTGWNFATTTDHRQLKQDLANSLAKSIKSTHGQIAALKRYQTPAQNSAALADKVKAARSAALLQQTALEAKYGKDGAAEMQRIARMHPVGIKRNHKATKYDLQAVAELGDPQDLSDTGYIS